MIRSMPAIATLLLFIGAARAATVQQKPYQYSYGLVHDATVGSHFMICDDTPRTPPVRKLVPPSLALRFGTGKPRTVGGPAAASEEPQPLSGNGRETSLDRTVLFDFDSARIRDHRELARVSGLLNATPSVRGVTVEGFTCDIGSKPHNDRLAIRRAEAVAALLKGKGVAVLETRGTGKCCYVPGTRNLSRRAEVKVVRAQGKDPKNAE